MFKFFKLFERGFSIYKLHFCLRALSANPTCFEVGLHMITTSGLSFNAKSKLRNILTFFGILKGTTLCVLLNAERFITQAF